MSAKLRPFLVVAMSVFGAIANAENVEVTFFGDNDVTYFRW